MRSLLLMLGLVVMVGFIGAASDGSVPWPGTDDGSVAWPVEAGEFSFDFLFFDADVVVGPEAGVAGWDCFGRCMLRMSSLCLSYCKWTGPFFWKCMAACEAAAAASCAAGCWLL